MHAKASLFVAILLLAVAGSEAHARTRCNADAAGNCRDMNAGTQRAATTAPAKKTTSRITVKMRPEYTRMKKGSGR